MNISFSSDDIDFQWENEQVLISWISDISNKESVSIEMLSYVFCSDESLLKINQNYLNHDTYTDIITFDLSDTEAIEGEIYISLHRVKENANAFKVAFEEELCRVISHGFLHLIGYNDHTDEEKSEMRAKETDCLSLLPEVPRGTFLLQ